MNRLRTIQSFVATCSVVLISLLSNQGASAQSSSIETLIAGYKMQVRDSISKLKEGAIPLFFGSASYRVGDICDTSMQHLMERKEHCFKDLAIISGGGSFERIVFKQETSVGFLLRLKRLFDFSGKDSNVALVTMDIIDVAEDSVAEGDFRRAFDPSSCEIAEPIIAGRQVGKDASLPVIIGRLYRGKRNISISYIDAASAEAKVKEIAALAAGVPVSVELNASVGVERSISVVDKDPV